MFLKEICCTDSIYKVYKDTKLFLQPISINVYFMEQVEMNNMYINIGVNNANEKGTKKKHCGFWEAN